jgi:hypothetical protein
VIEKISMKRERIGSLKEMRPFKKEINDAQKNKKE